MHTQQDVPDLRAAPLAETARGVLAEREQLLAELRRGRCRRGLLGLRRILLLFVAGVFFLLGIIGAVLPGLPATPFLLLTSYILVRSSPRLNAALLRSRFLGPILRDWQVHGGVRKDVKVKAVLMVTISVAVTSIVFGYTFLTTLGLLACAAIGIAVILRLPSPKRD
jgi:uncharacterized membrane protein YbaN (DUF454 family)